MTYSVTLAVQEHNATELLRNSVDGFVGIAKSERLPEQWTVALYVAGRMYDHEKLLGYYDIVVDNDVPNDEIWICQDDLILSRIAGIKFDDNTGLKRAAIIKANQEALN